MKTIQKDEIFQNIKDFLKAKGIDLQEGSYTHGIEHGCGVLADTINVSQQALHRARAEMGKRLDQVRQVIHENTAPKPPPVQSSPESSPAPEAKKKQTAGKKPAAGKSKKRAVRGKK